MNRQGVELKWLLFGMFLGSIGNSFVWPLTTIYIHDQLHESLTVSGIVYSFIREQMLSEVILAECYLTELTRGN